MSSYKNEDVYRMAARVGEISRQLGLWDDDMVAVNLDMGSITYGRAFRLNALHKGSSAHYRLPRWMGDDYLGMTKREACETLINRQNVLYNLADERGVEIDHDQVDAVVADAVRRKRVDWSLWLSDAPWAMASVEFTTTKGN